MPQYKLYYFNARGRAEVARLLFAAADVKYEDVRFERADWPAHKKDFTFGQVPVLEVDGKHLNQSSAIFLYLAKQFHLLGSNDFEASTIHAYIESLNDILATVAPQIMRENDPAKKVELIKTLADPAIRNGYAPFEAILSKSHSGYLVGDKLSVADLALFSSADTAVGFVGADILEAFPHIKKLHQKVGSHDHIKNWVAKRPVTQF